MNKYIARYGYWSPSFGIHGHKTNTIDKIIIEKETPKMVYFDNCRWAKYTDDYIILDTYPEAHNFLLQELTGQITHEKEEIIRHKENLRKLTQQKNDLQEKVDKDNLNKTTTFS